MEAGLMRLWIEQELAQLREFYPQIEHKEDGGEDWFRLPSYPFPPGWRIEDQEISDAPIAFKVVAAYPTAEPYGFAAPAGINFKGEPPKNTDSSIIFPFEGAWQHFSWAPDGWEPTNDVQKGSNLLRWVRSFSLRLEEGV